MNVDFGASAPLRGALSGLFSRRYEHEPPLQPFAPEEFAV